MRKIIKIKVQNGLVFTTFKQEVLDIFSLSDIYDFKESDHPDFIIFGPYGNDVPKPGPYTRIGYFCENIMPDFSSCEWAFGIPREERIKRPNYKRIQWHDVKPEELVKNLTPNEIDRILNSKKKFCNFIYSNPTPYREEFFRQLSKYKKIDAPGKSMNNCPSIDRSHIGTMWERKRQFLSEYKFTIAFENYVYPGYQTEKLYHPMQVNSIPIYCGDPYVGEVFNTKSFINSQEYLSVRKNGLISWLERASQQNFTDIRPQYFHSPANRIQRKAKAIGRSLKMHLQFNGLDFSDLVDRVIEVDRNPELYLQYLSAPWFKGNIPFDDADTRKFWITIFGN